MCTSLWAGVAKSGWRGQGSHGAATRYRLPHPSIAPLDHITHVFVSHLTPWTPGAGQNS